MQPKPSCKWAAEEHRHASKLGVTILHCTVTIDTFKNISSMMAKEELHVASGCFSARQDWNVSTRERSRPERDPLKTVPDCLQSCGPCWLHEDGQGEGRT